MTKAFTLTPDEIKRLRAIAMPGRDAIREIVDAVSEATGFKASDIYSTRRGSPSLAVIRQAVMFHAHEQGLSYAVIGACLGGRDHSTIKHGVDAEKRRRGMK